MFVRDDPLFATVLHGDDELCQQLRVACVVGAGALGVKTIEAAGPTVGDYCPDNVVAS